VAGLEHSSTRRATALDGLRGLAAAGVMAHHAWLLCGRPDTLLGPWWGRLSIGVPFFFCLSGFLLYGPWVRAALQPGVPRPATGRYGLRRAARVLPLYWLALAGSILVLHGTGSWRLVEDERIVWFLLFAQNVVPGLAGRLDPPMWTLTVEVSFYLLLPVFGALALRAGGSRSRQLVAIGALAVLGLAWRVLAQPKGAPPEVERTLPEMLPVFCAGMAARVLADGRQIGPRLTWALLGAGGLLVWAYARGSLAWPLDSVTRELPAAIGFAAVCAACGSSAAPRLLSCRAVLALGTLSFGVYLWHYPLIYALQRAGLWPADRFALALAILTALSITAAWLSWRLVEEPVLRAVQRRTSAPAARGDRGRGRPSERPAQAAHAGAVPPPLLA
jgi:peptidoglycan/LPS O-acetylase OafA/YrhL